MSGNLEKQAKFTPHTIHYYGDERKPHVHVKNDNSSCNLYYARRRIQTQRPIWSNIPDLRNVDHQPLFCTFCARAQNVLKRPCNLGPNDIRQYPRVLDIAPFLWSQSVIMWGILKNY